MKKWLLYLLVTLPLLAQAGSVYKWVDEKGVVHFSSKPHHEAEDVEAFDKPDSPLMSDGSPDESTKADKESTEAPKPEETASTPSPELLKYCKTLKSNLNTLKSSPRVRIKKENGEFEILGDQARQGEMDRIEKALKESCQ